MAEETGNTEPEELPPSTDDDVEAEGTVLGELVEGELADGELLVPDDWGDLSRDVDESVESGADEPEERQAESSEGALPSDLDIDFLGGEDEADLEPEDEGDSPSFDFGERFEADDADILDGLVFDEDSIGISRRTPEPGPAGALPDDLPIEFEDVAEAEVPESVGAAADSLDLWSVSLDGGWVADVPSEPAMAEGVLAELAAHGVERDEQAVPLAPLYGGTESFEAKLVERALVVEEAEFVGSPIGDSTAGDGVESAAAGSETSSAVDSPETSNSVESESR